ncbi:c-type cytochrome [Allohahella marinimesophila]|uniref:C-type cytochrome n=1 Tax=Allohahella marinimesophila TaxID=1054972 RepID=A0ABP7PF47_9GAMM
MPANEPFGGIMPVLTRHVILAGAMSCICVPVLADMIDESGMAPWEVCGLCHGLDGVSAMPKFPKLAGQNAAYISEQIHNFRTGLRANDGGQMEAIIGEIDPADIDAIATYFANLPLPKATSQQNDSGARSDPPAVGEHLFAYGKSGVQACADCHTNPSGKTPILFAQHEAYLVKQLADFASGERTIDPSRFSSASGACFRAASRLQRAEITALASFLANSTAPLIGPSAGDQ